MTSQFPFEMTNEMRDLSELMHLREITALAFPDSELRPVHLDVPTTLDDALTAFADQCFGFGRPQVPLDVALDELKNRGYDKYQVACFLVKKSVSGSINSLVARYKVPREEVAKLLQQAIGRLLTDNERKLLGAGLLLGSYAALGIHPDSPEFPGQLPLE